MDENEIRRRLWENYEGFKKTGEGEGYLDSIDRLLQLSPQCVDIFIEMFEKENSKKWKERLAQIILYVNHYEPAIKYLKEQGWDDFSGYAGFPEE